MGVLHVGLVPAIAVFGYVCAAGLSAAGRKYKYIPPNWLTGQGLLSYREEPDPATRAALAATLSGTEHNKHDNFVPGLWHHGRRARTFAKFMKARKRVTSSCRYKKLVQQRLCPPQFASLVLPCWTGIRRGHAKQLHKLDVVQFHGPIACRCRQQKLLRVKAYRAYSPQTRLSQRLRFTVSCEDLCSGVSGVCTPDKPWSNSTVSFGALVHNDCMGLACQIVSQTPLATMVWG